MCKTDHTHTFMTTSEEETHAVGRSLGDLCTDGTLIMLSGPLGAGKTILVKGIAHALGITDAIVSPTFTLVQDYAGSLELHHLDLYRIGGPEEFEGIGGEELLHAGGVTVVEWGERIASVFPAHAVRIRIGIEADGRRKITVEGGFNEHPRS